MTKLIVSIGIGMVAGILDVVPMIIGGVDWYSNISAFVFWVVMGVVISYSSLPVREWAKGMIIGLLSAVPVMILVVAEEPKSVIPMFFMSVILGGLVGFFTTGKYAR